MRAHPVPGQRLEAACLVRADSPRRRGFHNRPSQRVLGVALGRGRQTQQLRPRVNPAAGAIRVTRGFPSVIVPVLSNRIGVDLVRHLQRFAALDQNAALRRRAPSPP